MDKKRILLVEDEETFQRIATLLLSSAGYSVTAAASGTMALELLAAQEFELVLLDVMLPDMDGYQICSRIRQDHRTCATPVVMLTSRDRAEDRRRGMGCGADAYLTKPFRSAAVMDVIQQVLDRTATGTTGTA